MTGSESDAAASITDAREAFRELHGPRLHGFAILLTPDDDHRAAQLAADALADGMTRVRELTHPERAGAWLRARVVRAARRPHRRGGTSGARFEHSSIEELGVTPRAAVALGRLGSLERAALIALVVERFDRGDVATIVGRNGARLDRLVQGALQKFAARHAMAAPPPGLGDASGPMVEAIRQTAQRAMQ